MAASVNDKITKFSNGSQPLPTQLTAQKTAGATTASIAAATGWDTSTAKYIRMYTTTVSGSQTIPNQSSICFYKGTLSGTTLSNLTLIWSATGSDQTYAAGATVDLAVMPGYTDDLYAGLTAEHNQLDGTHSTTLITSRTEDTAPDPDEDYVLTYDASATALKKAKLSNLSGATDGWISNVLPAVSSVTNNGNRSYDITFASTVASILSPGMRLRTTRTVAAPTQCTSLNGTTQYYSKASPNKFSFTNNFVITAWVKLSSYAAAGIVSRYDGTNGWVLNMNSSGQVTLGGLNGSPANQANIQSYQSLPLNKWVHIAAKLDMTSTTVTGGTNNYMMFDGKEVPILFSRTGTNPTSLLQGTGSLNIGAQNGSVPFPGKIAQVAIYSAHVTEANIILTISQGLTGSETNLASAYSFNNSITDLNTTTPNDLTANGSAVATNADSPFGNAGTSSTLDYALVMPVSGSTATVQVPEGCTIPTSGGITSVAYSVQGNPFGWVSDKGRWKVASLLNTSSAITSNATYGSFISNGWGLVVPVGAWDLVWQVGLYNTTTTAVALNLSSTALTGLTIAQGVATSRYQAVIQSTAAATLVNTVHIRNTQTLSVATTFLVYSIGATTSAGVDGNAVNEIFAEPSGL